MNTRLLLVGAFGLLTFANAANINERVNQFDDWHIAAAHARSEAVSTLKSWESNDFTNISKRLSENKVTLGHANKIHETLEKAEASYLNTGLAYLGYSFILSIQILAEENSLPENYNDKTTESIDGIIKAIKTGKKYEPPFPTFESKFQNRFPEFTRCVYDITDSVIDLYLASSYDINVLFFNSDTGICDYRALNRGASIKAPVAGVPNYRSNFDGNINVLPIRFTAHDLGHVFFNDFNDLKYNKNKLDDAYSAYNTVENAMQKVSNNNIKPADDAIEFDLGHEQAFKTGDYGPGIFPTAPYTSEQFVKACNFLRDESIDSVEECLEDRDIYWDWEGLKTNNNLTEEEKDTFYSKYSKLKKLGKSENKLMSMVEIIEEFNLPKTRAIDSLKDLGIDMLQNAATYSDNKFENAADDEARHSIDMLDDYNELFGLKRKFKLAGEDFKIWLEDGTFNKDGMIKAITTVMDSFRDRYKDHI